MSENVVFYPWLISFLLKWREENAGMVNNMLVYIHGLMQDCGYSIAHKHCARPLISFSYFETKR